MLPYEAKHFHNVPFEEYCGLRDRVPRKIISATVSFLLVPTDQQRQWNRELTVSLLAPYVSENIVTVILVFVYQLVKFYSPRLINNVQWNQPEVNGRGFGSAPWREQTVVFTNATNSALQCFAIGWGHLQHASVLSLLRTQCQHYNITPCSRKHVTKTCFHLLSLLIILPLVLFLHKAGLSVTLVYPCSTDEVRHSIGFHLTCSPAESYSSRTTTRLTNSYRKALIIFKPAPLYTKYISLWKSCSL